MAYQKQTWVDHIEGDGQVVQQGTAMDALHFNHIEDGIFVANEHADKTDNPHGVTPKQLGFDIVFYRDAQGYICVREIENNS